MADASAPLADALDDVEPTWPPPGETADARAARLARERIMIEEAEEDFRQGRYLSGEAAEEWLRKWAAGEPVDVPFGR